MHLKPVLKWAGGKRNLAKIIIDKVGYEGNGTYFEPFVGGGAVLLYLQPEKAVCYDSNNELINLYNVIKLEHKSLISKLKENYIDKYEKDFFYNIRKLDRDPEIFNKMTVVERAARFLYLNKTCFNGLWRVNSKGQNNVPFGRYKNPKVLDEDAIENLHNYLDNNNITFINSDYVEVKSVASSGDFVYFDPPYDVEEDQSKFVGYTKNGFNRNDQDALKILCDTLIEKNVVVAVSNSNTEYIRNLYKDENYDFYTIHNDVVTERKIGGSNSSRKMVNELLIVGRKNETKKLSSSK